MRVTVDRLRITVAGARDQEHRLRGIAHRALELLAEHVRARAVPDAPRCGDRPHPRVTLPPIAVDLRRLPDEAVALRLAGALYGALPWRNEDPGLGKRVSPPPTAMAGR